MKRGLIKRILVCLVLGALTTVVAAWGFALRAEPFNWIDRALESDVDLEEWFARRPRTCACVDYGDDWKLDDHGIGACRMLQYLNDMPDWSDADSLPEKRKPLVSNRLRLRHYVVEQHRGWPVPSMRYQLAVTEEDQWGAFVIDWPSHVRDSRWALFRTSDQTQIDGMAHRFGDQSRALPLMPMPFGFALDTVLYGSCLFALWTATGTARRFVRRCCGLCTTCAYNLNNLQSERCPECGAAIRRVERRMSSESV